MPPAEIIDVLGFEVLDSRGNPTVEAEVRLADGSSGRAMVPSGASTGLHEAHERRDGDAARYLGRGVLGAVAAINGEIRSALLGRDAHRLADIDHALIALDGTPAKTRLGANAILGVSLAAAHAGSSSAGLPLFRHLGGLKERTLPVPLMNIINGGAHADNPLDFQEFMVVPLGAQTFAEAVRMGAEVFHTLKRSLAGAGHSVNVGDEGGFAPELRSAEQALDLICAAIAQAGYRPGIDLAVAIDPAASEFFADGAYEYRGEGTRRDREQQVRYLEKLQAAYPIVSIEDGMAEDDTEGWQLLTAALGRRCQLVGDDVFCTSARRLARGIDDGVANAVLVKVNQVGTLSEMFAAVETAQQAGYGAVMSHRSGETEDTTIADLAVAAGCGQIKTGSLSRSDRTAKYNRLLRIERELGAQARYAGKAARGLVRASLASE